MPGATPTLAPIKGGGGSVIILPWWERKKGRDALATWVYRSIRFRPYDYRFEPGTNPHVNFGRQEIVIDPIFSKSLNPANVTLPQHWGGVELGRPAQLDVVLARAATWHECAHVVFTDPGHTKGSLHATLVNILEDERIERALAVLQTWTARDLYELGRRLWSRSTTLQGDKVADWLNACLEWRWASEYMPTFPLPVPDAELWDKVRPLVEKSWLSETTKDVADIALEILKLLEIDKDTETPGAFRPFEKGEASGKPRKDRSERADFVAWSDDEPPTSYEDNEELVPNVEQDDPSLGQLWQLPYTDIEEAIRGNIVRVADELRAPDLEGSQRYADRGRISTEAIIRTHGEKPFILDDQPDDTPEDLAVLLLLDGTSSMGGSPGFITDDGKPGSMNSWNAGRYKHVRKATMLINEACDSAAVPLAIAYCRNEFIGGYFKGTGRGDDERWVIMPSPVVWIRRFTTPPGDETVKGRIAGLFGDAGREDILESMEETIPELQARPEGAKLVVYIHDGCPNDSEYEVREYLVRVRAQGVTVIGLFVGDQRGIEKLEAYFGKEYTVGVDELEQLGNRLGRLLRKMRWGR